MHNLLPATTALIAQGKTFINSGGRRNIENRTYDVALTCTDCHTAHKTENLADPLSSKLKLVNLVMAQKACDNCHQAARERTQSIERLLRGRED